MIAELLINRANRINILKADISQIIIININYIEIVVVNSLNL